MLRKILFLLRGEVMQKYGSLTLAWVGKRGAHNVTFTPGQCIAGYEIIAIERGFTGSQSAKVTLKKRNKTYFWRVSAGESFTEPHTLCRDESSTPMLGLPEELSREYTECSLEGVVA